MRVVVQKFGGTSLAAPEGREAAVRRVLAARRAGLTPVVVVSAMGRAGDPYATDTLIELGRGACSELPTGAMDLLMSCGEVVSAVVFSGLLRARGQQAIALTGGQAGILTDARFGGARIRRIDPRAVRAHLEAGPVCVVCGFQGLTEDGRVTTLGRGGSDITATALAAALGAERAEVHTDVEGIHTADPRIVSDTRILRLLSYEEGFEMAYQGARVVHPRAVDLAMRAGAPVRVRSTFAEDPGTLITRCSKPAHPDDCRGPGCITGIAHQRRLTLLTAHGRRDGAARVFGPLAEAGVRADFISRTVDGHSFAVPATEAVLARRLLAERGFAVTLTPHCGKISVVGHGIHGLPGAMATFMDAMRRAGIYVLRTASTGVTVCGLVRGRDTDRAVRALHRAFGLHRQVKRRQLATSGGVHRAPAFAP